MKKMLGLISYSPITYELEPDIFNPVQSFLCLISVNIREGGSPMPSLGNQFLTITQISTIMEYY